MQDRPDPASSLPESLRAFSFLKTTIDVMQPGASKATLTAVIQLRDASRPARALHAALADIVLPWANSPELRALREAAGAIVADLDRLADAYILYELARTANGEAVRRRRARWAPHPPAASSEDEEIPSVLTPELEDQDATPSQSSTDDE